MPSNLHNDENQLLLRVAEGDQTAFTVLFDKYHHELGTFIFGITRSKELTEEIVLDAFLKIWMTREVLADVKNFKAYLFTISRNAAITMLRKAIRERANHTEWNKGQSTHLQEEPDNKEFHLSLIDEAINQLSPQRKKIYQLSREKGLKYEEIATLMGISKFTVRAHIQQAVGSILQFVRSRTNNELLLIWLILNFL